GRDGDGRLYPAARLRGRHRGLLQLGGHMATELTDETYDIVPTALAVMAMRDNGYKNAAYAIAELMDNSIQAGATVVELLCGDQVEPVKERSRSRINQIAVLDNGCGMNADVLKMALQFGNGTHLTPATQDGMG